MSPDTFRAKASQANRVSRKTFGANHRLKNGLSIIAAFGVTVRILPLLPGTVRYRMDSRPALRIRLTDDTRARESNFRKSSRVPRSYCPNPDSPLSPLARLSSFGSRAIGFRLLPHRGLSVWSWKLLLFNEVSIAYHWQMWSKYRHTVFLLSKALFGLFEVLASRNFLCLEQRLGLSDGKSMLFFFGSLFI